MPVIHEKLQSLFRSRILGLSLYLIISYAITDPAAASLVNDDDVRTAQKFEKKARDIVLEIGDIQDPVIEELKNSGDSMNNHEINVRTNLLLCLDRRQQNTSALGNSLELTTQMMAIYSESSNKIDEDFSMTILKPDLTQTQGMIKLTRHAAEGTAGICRDSAAVNVKAQAIIDYTNDIRSWLIPLGRKLGMDLD
jgi:hypothetical protein